MSDQVGTGVKHTIITLASMGVTIAVCLGVLSYFDLFQLEAEPTALALTPIDLVVAFFLFMAIILLVGRYLPRGMNR